MRAKSCIALIAALAGGMGYLMAQTNESRITEVTVYTDRAMVTREAAVALKGGDQSVLIDNLPQSIDPNSIQVSGKGAFTLRDIKFTTKYLAATNSERQKALLAEKKGFEESVAVKTDGIKEAESERVFLDAISKKLTAPSSEPGVPVLDPEKWISMVKFYREKLTSIDSEVRLRRKEIAGGNKPGRARIAVLGQPGQQDHQPVGSFGRRGRGRDGDAVDKVHRARLLMETGLRGARRFDCKKSVGYV